MAQITVIVLHQIIFKNKTKFKELQKIEIRNSDGEAFDILVGNAVNKLNIKYKLEKDTSAIQSSYVILESSENTRNKTTTSTHV